MMETENIAAAQRARRLGVQAARVLDVAGYRPHPQFWPFGARHPAYHDLLDSGSTDARRLWAATWLLARLESHIVEEQVAARLQEERGGAVRDPYNARWRTTPHGALIEIARAMLRGVAQILREAGVVPQGPTAAVYAQM